MGSITFVYCRVSSTLSDQFVPHCIGGFLKFVPTPEDLLAPLQFTPRIRTSMLSSTVLLAGPCWLLLSRCLGIHSFKLYSMHQHPFTWLILLILTPTDYHQSHVASCPSIVYILFQQLYCDSSNCILHGNIVCSGLFSSLILLRSIGCLILLLASCISIGFPLINGYFYCQTVGISETSETSYVAFFRSIELVLFQGAGYGKVIKQIKITRNKQQPQPIKHTSTPPTRSLIAALESSNSVGTDRSKADPPLLID
jgi:hypothetical protein